jgi:Domain of unknown function (DUF4153)
MDRRPTLVLRVLAFGIALGVLGDLLLRATPWGINYVIWISCLLVANASVTGISAIHSGLAVPILFFAGCLSWRDSEFLQFWNIVASCGLCTLPLIQRAGRSLRTAWLTHYGEAMLASLRSVTWGTVSLLAAERPWQRLPSDSVRVAGRVALGLTFAVPLLFVFGALFSSADPAFAAAMESLVHVNVDEVFTHLVVSGIISTAAIGYLQNFVGPERQTTDPRWFSFSARGGGHLGLIEIAIPLVALIGLFVTFLAFQIPYLFGGASFVARNAQMTYAVYARRGFFELTTASGLVLPLLLAAHWALDVERPRARPVFLAIASSLIVLVGILMVSALHRMSVYVSVYGLSTDRIYAIAFMSWIGILLGWFAVTVLRGARKRFAFGAVVSGLVVLAGLNFLNPDDLVARTQLARARSGSSVDPEYLVQLSGDALPHVLNILDERPAQERCQALESLARRWPVAHDRDWRSWNLSRARARRALASNAAQVADCPTEPQGN